MFSHFCNSEIRLLSEMCNYLTLILLSPLMEFPDLNKVL